MSFTHQRIYPIAAFLTFHHGTMDVGDHSMSARDILPKLGNDGMGARNILSKLGDDGTGFGNSYMLIYHEFGLRMPS